MKKFLLSLCLWAMLMPALPAQNIIMRDKSELRLIGKNVQYWEDDQDTPLDKILQPAYQRQFQPHNKDVFAKPPSRKAVWFKITLQNKTQEDLWLEAGGTTACWYIDFYRPDAAGKYAKPVETGLMRPAQNREYPTNFYWLRLATAQDTSVRTYYMRVSSQMPREYPLYAGTIQALSQNKGVYDALTAGFLGWMLVMICYNLFLALATRDKIYLIYVAYLVAVMFNAVFVNNYPLVSGRAWWLYYPVWAEFTMLLVAVFAIAYLNLPKIAVWAYRYVLVSMLVSFFGFIVPNLLGAALVDMLSYNQITQMALLLSLLSIGAYLWAKGHKSARFYVLGWSSMLVAGFCMVLTMNGLLPFNAYARNAIYFGIAGEVLMFSLALADRLNTLRREKERAQQENLRLVQAQNELLTEKVAEKTQHLSEKTRELEAANEELHQQQEELLTLNDTLNHTYEDLKRTSDRLNASIHYAKSVQRVILPEDEDLRGFFAQHFVIYLPKDVVSGDFYWFARLSDTQAVFVLADCTGHGVPGAFMTMIGNTLLHEIVHIKGAITPARVLRNLDSAIRNVLKQRTSGNTDGMDITIALFEREGQASRVCFAGAKSLAYYTQAGELQEFRGDRVHLAGNAGEGATFTEQTVTLAAGERLYFMSDGFVDQNNAKRRPFSVAKLKTCLQEVIALPLEAQRAHLLEALQAHQSTELQRDDISLVGLQV